MRKLTIKKGIFKTDLLIDKYKFIIGNNEIQKLNLKRAIKEFRVGLPLSEYEEENHNNVHVYLDDNELAQKKINIYFISPNYEFYQELKLQSKSILLKAIINELSDESYIETFLTIQSLTEMLCIQFNEDHDIKLRDIKISPTTFAKLIEPTLVIDDFEMNEFDLSIEDFICLQLDLIRQATSISKQENLIIVDCPIVTNKIQDKVKEISNSMIIVFCRTIQTDYLLNNCYLIDKFTIDLADEESIYECICNEILCVSNLKEGVNYMKEYVKIVLGLEDGKTVS
ncbi:hypothetical protein [Solobacterium moorei]|uniref:hypothetical protein n=1 Tax=Solobacterium moorei TaxID=102148 RepID=UPI0028D29B75|nr:hypothetical protein [Solobacterium moorei]